MRRCVGHNPSVTLALAASAAVLALAAAVVEPYLDAAGNAATVAELDRAEPATTGLTVHVDGEVPLAVADEVDHQVTESLASVTETTERTVRPDPVRLGPANDPGAGTEEGTQVRLLGRTDATAALDLLDGDHTDGLLLPEVLAEEADLGPGDAVVVERGDVATEATVGGVYRELDPDTAPSALADLAELAERTPGREQRPLDLVFAAPDHALQLADELGATSSVSWRRPVTDDLVSLSDARTVRRQLQEVASGATDPRSELGSDLDQVARGTAEAEVGLAPVVRDAERAVAALTGPTRAVGLAGQGVALALVAAAAAFAARQRETELRLATIRGRSPLAQAAGAILRALVPLLLGGVIGWVAALAAVTTFGPPGALPPDTPRRAALAAAAALVPALLLIGAVTAGHVARQLQVGRRRRFALGRLPWEPAVLALAALALLQLRAAGGVHLEDGSPSLSPLVLGFPLLLLAGGIGLLGRVGRRWLPSLRHLGRHARPSRFLATRRLAAASGAGLLLTGAAALALGSVVYSAALAASLERSVEAKAAVQVGAEVVATTGIVDAAEVAGSEVWRARGRTSPVEETVDVLAVDPATFTDVAAMDAVRTSTDPEDLLGRLAAGDGDHLPAVIVGPPDLDAAAVDLPGLRAPLEVVEHEDAFPGLSPVRPLVVLAAPSAADLEPEVFDTPGWSRQVWAAGTDAEERLLTAGVAEPQLERAEEAAAQPRLVAVSWALTALQGFGILATVLALAGVLLFVAARQRTTRISYALARRMGLRPPEHRRALIGEVLVLLLVAWAVAASLGMLATALVAGGLDPLPDLAPSPRAAVPVGTLSVLAAVLAAAGVLGALALQRGADRADIAEVMRRG